MKALNSCFWLWELATLLPIDYIVHHHCRIGERSEVMLEERFDARRSRLYVRVVVVVVGVDELIERCHPFFV